MREHRQLKLAVTIHEVRVGEEIEPMRDVIVERVEQPVLLSERAALEHLLRFDLAFAAEVVDHQVAHLIAVARLFDHDAHERSQIVFARRVVDQKALLLVGGKLGIALIDDHVEHGVAHALIGNLADLLPAPFALEIAEVDLRRRQFAVLGLEAIPRHEAIDQLAVEADVAPPFVEHDDPVVERRDAIHVCAFQNMTDFYRSARIPSY